MKLDKVILEPILSEKSNFIRTNGKYVFKVDARANKIEVMKAVRKLFDVNPVSCNILLVKRKPKRVRYRKGYTSTWKKAIVTLPQGTTISAFDGA